MKLVGVKNWDSCLIISYQILLNESFFKEEPYSYIKSNVHFDLIIRCKTL